jgi:PAS domain S-box-containing protein
MLKTTNQTIFYLVPDKRLRYKTLSNKEQKTILLVDDEAIVGMDLSRRLNEYGYNVVHVLTGQKAIETVNDNKTVIDLILMDINLGTKIDGTEIAKTILKEHDIPLLFHSSYTEREVVNRTENITSYGYVVKNGITVLDASIKMAFRLHEAYQNLKTQKRENDVKKQELQMYEKRYRRLFESAKDGILILNADNGMIMDVNPFLIEMLGYSKEQFLMKNIWDISAFKNIDYSKHLYKELQEKEYVRYEDLPLETHDGKTINVEFVSNVYLVDNERVIQCNIRDITDRKKHEKTLKESIEKKGILINEIQHRIKNSFVTITSLIRLRSGAANSEETKNILDDLIIRIKSISDLYALLHETGSFHEVQLKTYCNKVIESANNLSKIITINKRIEEIIITSENAAALGMILVELLSNAIKYAFPGNHTGIINIDLKLLNSRVVLVFEDNGIGLPNDFDITIVQSLGLQIVYLLVDQLNGKIKIVSENGTKIIIDFPLEKII